MKKKITKRIQTLMDTDETLLELKKRYFKMALMENYPRSSNLTKKLDLLEVVIEKRKSEILEL